jgi:hypothetical protein
MDSERVLEDYTVLIQGTRIVALGRTSSVSIPDGATTIDGTGKYLMPGLAEMHGHIPSDGQGSGPDYRLNTLFLYVAGGVTTVRGMLGGPGQLELRERANRGEIVSPTLYLAGPAMHGSTVNSPDHASERVASIKAEGWDLVKVHEALSSEEYDAVARTAHDLGIRFGGHVTDAVSIEHAMAMGQETFDHMDGYLQYVHDDRERVDPGRLQRIVRLAKSTDSWVVPTLSLLGNVWSITPLETLQAYPELSYVSVGQVQSWTEQWNSTRANPGWSHDQFAGYIEDLKLVLSALNDAGAGILLGSDAPQRFSVPGFSLQHEMEVMSEAGLSPYEVYVTGTRNPGRYFQRSDSFGTVALGKRADLVLLEANPLESVENFKKKSGVMVRGRWLPWSEIQARLDAIAAAYSPGSSKAD